MYLGIVKMVDLSLSTEPLESKTTAFQKAIKKLKRLYGGIAKKIN